MARAAIICLTGFFTVLTIPCASFVQAESGAAISVADFQGKWKAKRTPFKTVLGKPLRLTVDIFNKKGKGLNDFRNSFGDRVFITGAVTLQIQRKGGKYRVRLFGDWELNLSKDRQTMTWTDKKGRRVTFKKQK